MLRNSIDGRKEEATYERPVAVEPTIEPPAAQRIRLRVGRVDEARFLSHLEFMNAWLRSLRRARAPLSYTQGFHAHPRVQFSAALPTGEESTGDYMDIILAEKVDPQLLLERLRATMPKGFMALGAAEVPIKASSLQAAVAGCAYSLITIQDPTELAQRVETIMAGETVPVMVKMKGKRRKGRGRGRAPREFKELDMKPYINDLSVRAGDSGDSAIIDLDTVCLEGRMARPRDIVRLLELDPARTRVLKRQTRLLEGNIEVQSTEALRGAQA